MFPIYITPRPPGGVERPDYGDVERRERRIRKMEGLLLPWHLRPLARRAWKVTGQSLQRAIGANTSNYLCMLAYILHDRLQPRSPSSHSRLSGPRCLTWEWRPPSAEPTPIREILFVFVSAVMSGETDQNETTANAPISERAAAAAADKNPGTCPPGRNSNFGQHAQRTGDCLGVICTISPTTHLSRRVIWIHRNKVSSGLEQQLSPRREPSDCIRSTIVRHVALLPECLHPSVECATLITCPVALPGFIWPASRV
ncbi:hypothetical protein VUR80DRAFT_851 [Thermomyces stellatus]